MKITLLFLILSINYCVYSQQWIWSKDFNSNETTQIRSIDLDKYNNVYVTGNLYGTLNIDAPSSLEAVGTTENTYIVKYNESGNYVWHKQLAGSGDISRGNIVITNEDSLVFCAFYAGKTDSLLGVVSSYNSLKSDILLAKYGSDGKLGWSKRIAWGPADVKSQHIAVDPKNNIYVAGVSTDTIYFENDQVITTSGGKIVNFVAKYNSQGKLIYITKINSSSTILNKNKFVEITAPNENEIYIGGFFTDSITSGTQKLYTGSYENALLIKIDGTGSVNWMRMAGKPNGNDRCNGVTTDLYGNVYITGFIGGSAIFDSTGTGSQDSSPLVASSADADMMIAKYNKNGILQWKRRNGSTGKDIGYGIYISENLLMYTGYYSGTVQFNNVTLNSGITTNLNTGFFVYDVNGNPVTASDIQGNGADNGECITYDNKGTTYIAGNFSSSDLTIASDVYDYGGTQDGFIAVYQNPFSATFSKHTPIKCNGQSTGELVATPYFGAAPYKYNWSANVIDKKDSLAYNLSAGTYSVTVTDSRDSSAVISYTIAQPTPITISAIQTDVSCHPANATATGPANNGSINITASGGTPNAGAYDYFWTSLSGSGANPTAEDQTALAKGVYKLVVRDYNKCELSDTFIVNQPPKISFAGSIVTDATPSNSNGAINLNVTGGNNPPAYTSYTWSNGATTEDISGLPRDNYTVVVKDIKTCQADTVFLVNDPTILLVAITNITDVDCRGNATGSATVEVKNGSGNYKYEWTNSASNPVGINSPTLSDVIAGTYYLKITDNGTLATINASVTIRQPSQDLSATTAAIDAKCYNTSTGVVNLIVNGGTLPYSYSWSNSTETTEDLVNTNAALYGVTVTDDRGCTAPTSSTVKQPDPLLISFKTDLGILCHGYQTGRVTATVTGGFGDRTYLWNDPGNQTEATATTLFSGAYTLSVTDLNECLASDNISLTQPDSIKAIPTITEPTCYSGTNASLALTTSGGTPSYSYIWSNGRFTPYIDNVNAGTYSVQISDGNGCIKQVSFDVPQPVQITIENANITDPSCFGFTDGQIAFSTLGGIGDLEYSVDGGNTFISTSLAPNVSAGQHSLVVRDNNNCLSPESVVTVGQPNEIIFQEVRLSPTTCQGDSDGWIEITANGGIGGPYTYSINDGNSFTSSSSFTSLSGANYHLRVSDGTGCISADSVMEVPEPQGAVILSELATDVSCYGYNNGAIEINVDGPATDYEYSIDNGANYYNNEGLFTDLVPGTYQVALKSKTGCEQTNSTLVIDEPTALIVDTTNVIHALSTSDGVIEAEAAGGTSTITYVLKPSVADSITNPNGEFRNLSPGSYTLRAIDDNLCSSNAVDVSIMQQTTDILIYDAFSPNGDGDNDVWNIYNIWLFPNCKVEVYNTWGSRVFSSTGYTEPWDGIYNGKNLPAGTYYYIIDLKDGSDTKAGSVSIVE